MEFINNLPESDDIFCSDEGSIVFLHKPSKLDNPPKIDESYINEKYLTICKPECVKEYFNDITNDHIRLINFNGMLLDNTDSYYCDYCRISIKDDWYYCFHCYKDMCKMCYQEVDEETAIKNGAKNYKAREDALNECRTCNKIQSRPIFNVRPIYSKWCDICRKKIEGNIHVYSITIEDDIDYDTFDICMECYKNKEDARNIVETRDMELLSIENRENFLFNYTDFNSLSYWIPIISDKEGCHIFMNLNPDDKNYGKLCLQSCDDHGRFGYFIIYDESITLDVLLNKLKEITDKGTFEYEDYEKVEDGVYEDEIIERKNKIYIESDDEDSEDDEDEDDEEEIHYSEDGKYRISKSGYYMYAADDEHHKCGELVSDYIIDENGAKKFYLMNCDGTKKYYQIDEDGKKYEIETIIWHGKKTIKEPVYKTVLKTAKLGSKYYSGPIHIIMQEFGMPVYYG